MLFKPETIHNMESKKINSHASFAFLLVNYFLIKLRRDTLLKVKQEYGWDFVKTRTV